ncbi:hypothetical protein CIT292_08891 [Citrobacter youngae ATCC 29220]|uniref:Uncharacterized protein n=1 Tax=Citrobacter youngae ATCC 29220 TaxID=500640 RepID=D4BEF9_9ENTR|nr:hypothetical protein CIT292_08891 [Citrobacter youngae ATCC 29220]
MPAGSAFIPVSGHTKVLHFTRAYLQLYEKVFGDFIENLPFIYWKHQYIYLM